MRYPLSARISPAELALAVKSHTIDNNNHCEFDLLINSMSRMDNTELPHPKEIDNETLLPVPLNGASTVSAIRSGRQSHTITTVRSIQTSFGKLPAIS